MKLFFQFDFRRLGKCALASGLLITVIACGAKKEQLPTTEKPVLSVMVIGPRQENWPMQIQASGNVVAWQEASIGAEIGGLKLLEVLVNVGDSVHRGQLLARMSDASVRNDLAQQKAAVEEAEANLAQARKNLDRARDLEPVGSVSHQDVLNYETQAATTIARLAAAKAMLSAQSLRLTYTKVIAPDDGVISARLATVGAVLGSGSELFKLIRKNRLEWRGELRADDLLRVEPGQVVEFSRPDGTVLKGVVRQVAPTVDTAVRTGLVYVDLPARSGFKAGMFVSAALQQQHVSRWTIPQPAVIVRDGFEYAMRVGSDNIVRQTKLSLGKRQDNAVELLSGLKPQDRVVAFGGSFVNEGDLVRVVDVMPRKNNVQP